jgi:hypothetical protein
LRLVKRPEGTERALILFFVADPGEEFWSGHDHLDNNGTRVAWFQIGSNNDATERKAVLVEAGQDGYYFSLDAIRLREAGGKTIALCPARDSILNDCRRYSLLGLSAAVRFVCNRSL